MRASCPLKLTQVRFCRLRTAPGQPREGTHCSGVLPLEVGPGVIYPHLGAGHSSRWCSWWPALPTEGPHTPLTTYPRPHFLQVSGRNYAETFCRGGVGVGGRA